jgi:hypothetical protein
LGRRKISSNLRRLKSKAKMAKESSRRLKGRLFTRIRAIWEKIN